MRKLEKLDRRILAILIPAILENALLTVSGMILTAYIGRLEINEISAYGIATRIYSIYFAMFKGFSIGTMIFLARAFGEERPELCARLQQILYTIVLPVALIASILIYLNAEYLLGFMSTEQELIVQAAQYIRQSIWSYPLVALVHLNSSAFQAKGNTKVPLYIAFIGNLMNIIIGYVLIFGFDLIPTLHLQGAAIAQNLQYTVMFLVGIRLLYGKHGLLIRKKVEFSSRDFCIIHEIINAGIPAAIENTFWSFAMVVLSKVILSYGQNTYAGFQFGLQGEGFCDMMTAGFMTAALSLSSNAIGAKNKELYEAAWQRLGFYCRLISLITSLFLLFFSKSAISLLTDKPELIEIGSVYLLTMFWSQYPVNKQKVVFGYLRSAGYVKTPMIITFIGIWCVRVDLVLLFGYLHLPIIWIWWAMNIDQWTREILAELFFRKKHVLNILQYAN